MSKSYYLQYIDKKSIHFTLCRIKLFQPLVADGAAGGNARSLPRQILVSMAGKGDVCSLWFAKNGFQVCVNKYFFSFFDVSLCFSPENFSLL
ncbi:MAG: hypothetical protein MI753_00520 [Hyphomicrobiales bacterium]|nr:hypothetical protein [Hyphomicrobiales bacterium]